MMSRIGAFLVVALLGAFDASGSADVSASYFAPVNRMVFRLTQSTGAMRDFTPSNPRQPNRFYSKDGWRAKFGGPGKIIVNAPDSRERLVFDRGRLVTHILEGRETRYDYNQPRGVPDNMITPLATFEYEDSFFEEREREDNAARWQGTGRLRIPFDNPNQSGAFYALIAVVAFVLAFSSGRKVKPVVFGLSAVAAALAVWTGSRGALLGLAVGVLPALAVRGRELLRRRAFWLSLFLLSCAVAVWAFLDGGQTLTRGFSAHGVDWSNSIRMDMWKAAPRMMVDAPQGWGFCGAGRAYLDWYQPPPGTSITGSLMNDHLTTLVERGWLGRFLYLSLWFLVLGLGLGLAVRRRTVLPLSVWGAFGVMAWFNPIFGVWALWIAPVAACLCFVRPFGKPGRRAWLLLSASCVLAAIVLGLIWWTGKDAAPRNAVGIAVKGSRVLLKTMQPRLWIVDDEQGALGGLWAGQEIREWLVLDRSAPAVGYVRDVAALPTDGSVERLVLAGKAATDWMTLLSEHPEARTRLPKSVLLISPPFAPSDIPEGVLKCTRLRVVVGEFAARFQPEYAAPEPYVTIVTGAERYINGWMRFAVGG